jgi:hypothetical protein
LPRPRSGRTRRMRRLLPTSTAMSCQPR